MIIIVLARAVLSLFWLARGVLATESQGEGSPFPKQLNAFGQGFICEFENARNVEPQVASDVQRQVNQAAGGALGPVEISKRFDMTSDIFSGASFGVTKVTGSATDEDFKNALQAIPQIKAVYPIKEYFSTGRRGMRPLSPGLNDPLEEAFAKRQQPSPGQQPLAEDNLPTHVMTGVDRLHAEGVTGAGIKVAILDTGVDYLHPALGAGFGAGFKVVGGYDLVGDKYNGSDQVIPASPDPDPLSTCNDHGTHVSGIIGANAFKYNVTGVAPDASLEMYRVFGCYGVTQTDVGVNASLRAFESGADVIHASIGSDGGWSDDAWAVVADRINGNGTFYSFSAGNSGQDSGIFAPNALSSAPQIPAIAAVDNVQSPELVLNATWRVDNGTQGSFLYSPGWPQNFTRDMEVYALSFDTGNSSDACDELPNTTPDISNKLVLILRTPRCKTDPKVTNIRKAGGRFIMFYNDVDDNPGRPLPYYDYSDMQYDESDDPALPQIQGIGIVNNTIGKSWIEALSKGRRVYTTLPTSPEDKQLLYRFNNQTGGRLSIFTSWGPSYEALPGVTVAGPGGNILSTLSRRVGGYGVYSGTSMAGPFVAGVAALIKSVNPGITVPEIISRLAVTGRPMEFHDNSTKKFDYLAPVFQQGGGLVDAYQAVRGTTLLNASVLNYNDTAFFKNPQFFSITNNGTKSLTYNFTHIGAGTVYALPEGENEPQSFDSKGFLDSFSTAYATVQITPQTVDLAAGDSATVSVSVTYPDLDRRRIPLVSGYIAANASDGTSVTLPYNGIASALRNAVVLDPEMDGNYLISASNASLNNVNVSSFLDPAPQGSGSVFFVPKVDDTSLLNNVTLPGVQFVLAMGSRRVDFDVLRDADSVNLGTAVVLNPTPLYTESYSRDSSYVRLFYGMLNNQTYAPEGEYKFLVRALRITGDPKNLDDYDSFTTDKFFLRYTS